MRPVLFWKLNKLLWNKECGKQWIKSRLFKFWLDSKCTDYNYSKGTQIEQKTHTKKTRGNAKWTNKVASKSVTTMTIQKYKFITVTKSPYLGRNCNNVSVIVAQFCSLCGRIQIWKIFYQYTKKQQDALFIFSLFQ